MEELPAARSILLGPRRQVQQRLFAVRQNAPGRQHGLARPAQMQPLGNAIDKQVGDREFRQITAGKRLVLRPQPLGDLAHRGAAQQAAAIDIGKHRLNVARRQPARVHLHRQSLQLLGAAPHHLPDT